MQAGRGCAPIDAVSRTDCPRSRCDASFRREALREQRRAKKVDRRDRCGGGGAPCALLRGGRTRAGARARRRRRAIIIVEEGIIYCRVDHAACRDILLRARGRSVEQWNESTKRPTEP